MISILVFYSGQNWPTYSYFAAEDLKEQRHDTVSMETQ